MNVTIIYGSMDSDNIYNCVKLFLKKLKYNVDNISINEFFLPNELSNSHFEHLHCFMNDKYVYSNFNGVQSIINVLNKSDLIILGSSVYSCDISPQMKLLLDTLSDMLKIYNANSTHSNKIGLVMSTTAGAGLANSTKTLKRYLQSWGIKRTFIFSRTLYELNWLDVNLKTKQKISQQLSILAHRVSKHPNNTSSKANPIFNLSSFLNMRKFESKKYLNVIDFPTQKRTKSY